MICSRCKKTNLSGKTKVCDQCKADNRVWKEANKEKIKAYYQLNKEKIKQKSKEYRLKNLETIKERHKEYARKNSHKVWAYQSIRTHKERGIAVLITKEEVVLLAKKTKKCCVCGIDLSYQLRQGKGKIQKNSPSLDRIDNNKGLESGNLQILCVRCNSKKGRKTMRDFAATSAEWLAFDTILSMSSEPSVPSIVFLHDAYKKELSRIRGNQDQIKMLKLENQRHRDNMEIAKKNMNELLKILIKEEGSFYKVFQKYFGEIDKRYYQICSLLSGSFSDKE